MPSEEQHKGQFARNYKTVQMFRDQSINDWVVTVSFYACLHAVEWYFCKEHEYHSPDHKNRDIMFRSLEELRPIYRDYRELCLLSQETRYDCVYNTLSRSDVSFSVDTVEKIAKHIRNLNSKFPDIETLKINSSGSA